MDFGGYTGRVLQTEDTFRCCTKDTSLFIMTVIACSDATWGISMPSSPFCNRSPPGILANVSNQRRAEETRNWANFNPLQCHAFIITKLYYGTSERKSILQDAAGDKGVNESIFWPFFLPSTKKKSSQKIQVEISSKRLFQWRLSNYTSLPQQQMLNCCILPQWKPYQAPSKRPVPSPARLWNWGRTSQMQCWQFFTSF